MSLWSLWSLLRLFNRPYILCSHLKLARRFLLAALDMPRLPHAGKKLLKISVFHFKPSSIVMVVTPH